MSTRTLSEIIFTVIEYAALVLMFGFFALFVFLLVACAIYLERRGDCVETAEFKTPIAEGTYCARWQHENYNRKP